MLLFGGMTDHGRNLSTCEDHPQIWTRQCRVALMASWACRVGKHMLRQWNQRVWWGGRVDCPEVGTPPLASLTRPPRLPALGWTCMLANLCQSANPVATLTCCPCWDMFSLRLSHMLQSHCGGAADPPGAQAAC